MLLAHATACYRHATVIFPLEYWIFLLLEWHFVFNMLLNMLLHATAHATVIFPREHRTLHMLLHATVTS